MKSAGPGCGSKAIDALREAGEVPSVDAVVGADVERELVGAAEPRQQPKLGLAPEPGRERALGEARGGGQQLDDRHRLSSLDGFALDQSSPGAARRGLIR